MIKKLARTFPLLALCLLLPACDGGRHDGLTPPEVLVSPYDSVKAEPLWAIAPLRNESGTSAIDTLEFSDILVAKVQEIRGVSAIPMNRVLGAMRSLGLREVRTPGEARTLANALGVDGIIVGSITAWDPYDPPKIGITLGLFGRGSTMTPAETDPYATGIDSRTLAASATERTPSRYSDHPLSVVVEHFDAKNHEVLMNVQRYAAGRTEKAAPLGWKSYTANMELYSGFVAYWTMSELLDKERLRMAQNPTHEPGAGGGAGKKGVSGARTGQLSSQNSR